VDVEAHGADDAHQGFPGQEHPGTGTAASRRGKEAADAQPPRLGGKSAFEALRNLLQLPHCAMQTACEARSVSAGCSLEQGLRVAYPEVSGVSSSPRWQS